MLTLGRAGARALSRPVVAVAEVAADDVIAALGAAGWGFAFGAIPTRVDRWRDATLPWPGVAAGLGGGAVRGVLGKAPAAEALPVFDRAAAPLLQVAHNSPLGVSVPQFGQANMAQGL